MVIIKLNNRQQKLQNYLLKQKGFVTAKKYSEELGVSERTIYSDLEKITENLSHRGIKIKKRPGIGIGLTLTSEEKESETSKITDECSTYDRRKKIIEWLLFNEQYLTFEALSEEFLVSKTSIKNDFNFIKTKILSNTQLKLVSDNYGTRLIGTEVEFQKAFIEFNRLILNESEPKADHLGEVSLSQVKAYYGESLVSVCTRVLYGYIKKEVNVIAEHYILNVLNVLIVLVFRISKGKHIVLSLSKEIVTKNAFFEESAEEMLNKIALRLDIEVEAKDIIYFSKHLISNRFKALPEEVSYQKYVDDIIQRVSSSLKIDFLKDKKLVEQLNLHIPTMIYRLKANYKTENPFLTQIKTEFAITFNVIWVLMSEYEEELGVTFNEDEIGFLTIHFQAAIERNRMNKRILVVCPMGIATSELLVNRIKNILPSFDLMEVASIKEINEIDTENIDFIISTVPLEIADKEILIVSPLLSEQDIQNIARYYQGNKLFSIKKNEFTKKKLVHMPKYMKKETIFFNECFKSKEEVIDRMGEYLIKHGYVKPAFVDTLIKREHLGGTDLPVGAAIPHGNPKFVNQTAIVFVKNDKSFKWGKYSVRTIIIVAISEEDKKEIRNILSDIYELVESKDTLKKIYQLKDKKEFMEWIGMCSR